MTATFAVRHDTAVVELATAAGIGQVVLGIGGSATTDGGAGMLQALGARLLEDRGADVPPGGAGLATLERIEVGGLDPCLRDVEIVVASDVDNLLTGPDGAAATFASQKGASAEQVAGLETALVRFAPSWPGTSGWT